MESSMFFIILLQLFLIALNAIFACAEIAVISMNDNKLAKLAENGDKRAIRLEKLTDQPARFLSTIQVGITLSGFLGSAFAADNFSQPLADFVLKTALKFNIVLPQKTIETISLVVITVILSYFTLVFGELVPKRIAMRKAESLALGMSRLISAISIIFRPLVSFLTVSTNGILRLFGIDPNEEDSEVSEEEIRMLVDVGNEKGAIDNHEKEFIQNVFEFDDITAGEIITHRTDLTYLFLQETAEEWEQTIYESRFTLYPVCDESPDNVVGILQAKEYLRLKDRSRESVMEKAVLSPYFVPENVKADVLFRNMKSTHNKIAVVLDEYGGLCGVVTMNDLVEQLVGDLGYDEVDEEEPEETLVEKIDDETWKISGKATLEYVSEVLGISLDDEEHDTFNGYAFSALETVPQDGTTVSFETDLLIVEVTDISEHQIDSALVKIKEQPIQDIED